MKTLLSSVFLLLFLSSYARHPLQLSVVNMTVDSASKQIDYSIRLHQEDIIHLTQLLYHDALHHNLPVDSTLLVNYLRSKLKISNESHYFSPILNRIESTELEYCVYFTLQFQELPEKVLIENFIMLELNSEQQNLLIFSSGNEEKGLTFDHKNTSHQIFLFHSGN